MLRYAHWCFDWQGLKSGPKDKEEPFSDLSGLGNRMGKDEEVNDEKKYVSDKCLKTSFDLATMHKRLIVEEEDGFEWGNNYNQLCKKGEGRRVTNNLTQEAQRAQERARFHLRFWMVS